MSSARRLQVMYETKQQEWEAIHDRLTSLRRARTIETDPENQFKFDRRIKSIEQDLKVIQDELNQIEQQLNLPGNGRNRFTSEQVTPTSFTQQQKKKKIDSIAYLTSNTSKPSSSPKRKILAGFLIMVGIGLLGTSVYYMVVAPYTAPVALPIGLLGLLIGGGGTYLW